jgi:membrane-associated phospholipid phosphatase
VKALRSTEWLLIGYFSYLALISASRLPALLLLLAMALVAVLVYGESHGNQKFFSIARDWAPLVLTLVLTLVAYREMDWFTPLAWDHHLEFRWIEWDRSLLYGWGFERAVESLGAIVPSYLEFCYLLVYAVGPFTVTALYIEHRRNRVNVMTALRRFNLWIVNGYGIHSSVFPSAHVSSAFSAGWALLLYLPERKRYGWGMLIYAVSVSVAAVYGRYHYAVDVLAGFGVSLVAAGIIFGPRMHTDTHG